MCIYGLDVKDRLRGENRSKFWRDRVRAYTARNYGAVDRYQIAIGTLLTQHQFNIRLRMVLTNHSYTNQLTIYYFTNLSVFRFNSTFTFLPNTYVNPCTLVRPI